MLKIKNVKKMKTPNYNGLKISKVTNMSKVTNIPCLSSVNKAVNLTELVSSLTDF